MVIIDDGRSEDGSGTGKPKKPKQPRPKKPHKGHKGRGRTGHKKGQGKHKTVHPGTFHEQAGAGSAGRSAGASPALGHPAGSGMSARVLAVPALGQGLSDIILDLAGEGSQSVSQALSAWQREQDRLTNRAWRRPGGLARIGKV